MGHIHSLSHVLVLSLLFTPFEKLKVILSLEAYKEWQVRFVHLSFLEVPDLSHANSRSTGVTQLASSKYEEKVLKIPFWFQCLDKCLAKELRFRAEKEWVKGWWWVEGLCLVPIFCHIIGTKQIVIIISWQWKLIKIYISPNRSVQMI